MIGTLPMYGEEPEEAAVVGGHLAPDIAVRLSYADVISPTRGLEPWIHHVMPEAMGSKFERAFEIAEERVAVALIQEALHHAGLCEYPHDRTAMRSGDINTLVSVRCRLD